MASGKYNSDNLPARLRTKNIPLGTLISVGADTPTIDRGDWSDPSILITTPAANGASTATRTVDLKFELVVPTHHVTTASLSSEESAIDGIQDGTIRASVQLDPDAPLVSHALDLIVKKSNGQGGVGSDLCTTAQFTTIADSWEEKEFTIDLSGCVPGDVLQCVLRMALNDTGGSSDHTMQLGGLEFNSYERN